jgi:hypothetical protein
MGRKRRVLTSERSAPGEVCLRHDQSTAGNGATAVRTRCQMEHTFVTGKAVFRIRQAAGPSEGQMTVTITRDDRLEWTYRQASWRPLAAGWGCGSAYLWSARDLVVLPDDPGEDPSVLALDEDLLFVFGTEAGWVLVCETSVRLITGKDQGSRIDLADTIERAWWTGETLQIQDTRGTGTAVTVTGDRLVVIPGQAHTERDEVP